MNQHRVAVAAALLALLAACDHQYQLASGTVTYKQHQSTWLQPIVTCTRAGASTVCNTTMVVHPEAWRFKLRETDCARDCEEGYVDVGAGEFDRYTVGAVYP